MRVQGLVLSLLVAAECVLAVPATTTQKTTSTSKQSTSTSTQKTTSTVKTTTSTKKTTTTSTKKTTSTSTKKSTTTSKTTSSTKTTSTTSKPTTTTTSKATTTTTSKPTTTTTSKTSSSTTTFVSSTTTIPPSSTASATPTKSSGKRGLAFNDPELTKPFSLSGQKSKVNWAYNWASDPYYPGDEYTPNSFNKVLTYVPMLWSAASDLTSIWQNNVQNAIATYGTDSVLSFNEPDGCCWSCGNSCMNVSEAVSAYRQWVQPLAGKVKLGSPAVTNGVGEGIGISYMEYFMGNCTSCQVDFIPIHWYGSVLDPNSFTAYVQSFYQKFNKPIWITEFGTSSGTDAQIITFLQQVLPWLDSQSYVQRYAYFMDTNSGSPYLLNSDDTMTSIGVQFNSG